MLSFIFYTHSSRISDLEQTIRFLRLREPKIDPEIIIVFQDIGPNIKDCKIYNLHLETYQKPIMCNLGVSKSKQNIIAILDSDRILPENYFTTIASSIKEKEMITTSTMWKLLKPYSDEDIINKDFKYSIEYRSKNNYLRHKNLFSGNTIFWKKDYIELGGMDERYIGYGYADTDMTQQAIYNKIQAKYLNINEIHLYHEREVYFKNKPMKDFQILCAINVLKYSIKWKKFDPIVDQICKETMSKIDNYPIELQNKFKKLIRNYFIL